VAARAPAPIDKRCRKRWGQRRQHHNRPPKGRRETGISSEINSEINSETRTLAPGETPLDASELERRAGWQWRCQIANFIGREVATSRPVKLAIWSYFPKWHDSGTSHDLASRRAHPQALVPTRTPPTAPPHRPVYDVKVAGRRGGRTGQPNPKAESLSCETGNCDRVYRYKTRPTVIITCISLAHSIHTAATQSLPNLAPRMAGESNTAASGGSTGACALSRTRHSSGRCMDLPAHFIAGVSSSGFICWQAWKVQQRDQPR
jgi:hypothetical protein